MKQEIREDLQMLSGEFKEDVKSTSDEEPQKLDRRARERTRLLEVLASGKLDTLVSRVAYVLNHHKETRNSDMALKLKYWEVFQGFNGNLVDVNRMFELERDTSIARARAKVQNEYKLFTADENKKIS